jgi:hypothetical protein
MAQHAEQAAHTKAELGELKGMLKMRLDAHKGKNGVASDPSKDDEKVARIASAAAQAAVEW